MHWVLLHWLLTLLEYNLTTFLSSAYPFHLIYYSWRAWTLHFSSYWHIVTYFPVFIFVIVSTNLFFFLLFIWLILFTPWVPAQEIACHLEAFPSPLCGLQGHLCLHSYYLFVILSIPHHKSKATRFFFAFLLPKRVLGTDQSFSKYLNNILREVFIPDEEWI